MPIDIHLKQTLEELDNKYGGDEMFRLFGPTLLSWNTIDSSRAYMFTSHIKQALTLLEPDVPRLSTHFENTFGEYSNAYKKLKGTWKVVRIIPKFSNVESQSIQIYTIVLYNKDTDTYDMFEKPIAENLTEKFGYIYNTNYMDSLHEGDIVKDPILYKSTSYDDSNPMNYRYGKNARVYYSTSTDTIEDAVVVRRGWAEHVKSVEVDELQVPINDNDVLLNLYGNDEIYKPFPDVGEFVKDSLICASRRINKAHLLYDFQPQHLREVLDTDSDFYTSKNSIVYDINVYYNGDEEFPSNIFNSQLKRYYEDGQRYANEILEVCNMIKASGSHYTQNVGYFRARYLHFTDKDYKWKNQDSVFSHIILEFKVRSVVSIELGAKVTGRFGNKGVISRIVEDHQELSEDVEDKLKEIFDCPNISIVDDERMPYYIRDGERIYADIQFNSSGAIRRLNPGQLVEVELNYIAEQVQYKIKKAETIDEKLEIFFKFLDMVNHDQCTFFRTHIYGEMNKDVIIDGVKIKFIDNTEIAKFIKDIEDNGFYIVREPHRPLLFDDIIRIYDAFPDIKPVDLYIDLFGMQERKILRKGIIGYQYIMVLKQNSNKNFSARSTFRVNRSNLPAKDIAKKTNRSSYARTPVRLSEIYNLLASITGEDLAEYNIFMRSSALGRKSLDRILAANGNPLKIKKLKVQDNYSNANADILAAKLKSMGLRIYFSPLPEGRRLVYDKDTIVPLHYGDYTIHDNPTKRGFYQELFNAFNTELKKNIWVESYRGEKHDVCWDTVFTNPTLIEKYGSALTDELKMILKACTKGRASEIRENITKLITKQSPSPKITGNVKKRGRKSKAEIAALKEIQEKIANGENIIDDLINENNSELDIDDEDDVDIDSSDYDPVDDE